MAPGAPWCTLCYADLRPKAAAPTDVSEPAVAMATPQSDNSALVAAVAVADPLTAPLSALAPDSAPEAAPETATAAPPPMPRHAGPSAAPTWPCLGCGARMAMSEDACHACGRPFLTADSVPSLSLPGLGDVSKMDKMQRAFLTVGGVIGVMFLFVLLAFLGGKVL